MKRLGNILFFVAIFLLLFIITVQSQYLDYDIWARLIAGMGVVEGHHVLKADFLSYTPTHVWYDHEYGSGVIFYCFLKYFGKYSLLILQTIILFFTFFFVLKAIEIRGIKRPYNIIFWIISILAISRVITPIRCQLFSFLFFAVFLYILEKAKTGKYKILYLLPLITLLWNNLHGGVVAGLGLTVLYIFGEILNKNKIKHYILAGLSSLAVLIINPWGISYLQFLLSANTMQRTYITEWFGLFSQFQIFNQLPFKVFMLLIVFLEIFVLYKICKQKKAAKENLKFDKTKYLILTVTLILSVCHIKLLPFFVISGGVFCYEDFALLIENKISKLANIFSYTLIWIIIIAGLAVNYPCEIPFGAGYYPHREVEFIKQNKLEGNLLSNFGYGSFIAYKLYPQNKIYMDGRYEEVYNNDLIILLKQFYLIENNWDEILKKYPPDIMILENWYPIYEKINQEKDWIKAYETEMFGVFIKKELKKEKYIQPTEDVRYYKNTLFDTSVKF